jgi:hypothetical protein
MVDEQQVPAWPHHAGHLGEQRLGVRDDGGGEHRHRDVEAAIGEGHALRIHLEQPGHVGQAFLPHALGRLGQHVARQVDADHALFGPVARQGEAGADAHFQHARAGQAVHLLHGAAASVGGHAAEDKVIDARPAAVGVAHAFRVQNGARVMAIGGVGAEAHPGPGPAAASR